MTELSAVPVHSFDLAIRCGKLLTMAPDQARVIDNQVIGIRGEKIVWIGPHGSEEWVAPKVIDASQKIVLPGLINTHMHLPMSLFRGLADDLPFEQWLNQYILPLEGRLVGPDFVRVGTELSALECIQRGTTTLCDMYYFESDIAEVVDKAGLRAWLGETVADFPQPDDKKKEGLNYRMLDNMMERYGDHDRIHPVVAPHAPYTCSDATLQQALAYAQKANIPLFIHVSETRAEVENSRKEFGKSPVARLQGLGYSDHLCVYAHCVHVDDADIALLAQSRIGIAHNPESNMKLGSGIAPIRKLLNAGARVGLGTDGAASNNDLNLWNEMDTACKLQKLAHADNTAMTAWDALRMATWGGACALGAEGEIGSLEVGKFADLIIVDPMTSNMQPLHDCASQLVYASTGTEVETVICHGQILMEEWQVLSMNRRDVLQKVSRLRERMNF